LYILYKYGPGVREVWEYIVIDVDIVVDDANNNNNNCPTDHSERRSVGD